jgi:hypothetical protein
MANQVQSRKGIMTRLTMNPTHRLRLDGNQTATNLAKGRHTFTTEVSAANGICCSRENGGFSVQVHPDNSASFSDETSFVRIMMSCLDNPYSSSSVPSDSNSHESLLSDSVRGGARRPSGRLHHAS